MLIRIRECNNVTLDRVAYRQFVVTDTNGRQETFTDLNLAKLTWISKVLAVSTLQSIGVSPGYNFVANLDYQAVIVAENADQAILVEDNVPYIYHKTGKFAGYFETANTYGVNYINLLSSQTFTDSEGKHYRSCSTGWQLIGQLVE